jgi:hypothetical protein
LKSSFCLLSSSSDESNCPSLILEASIWPSISFTDYLISESSCSEYPSLDTPGPPTPMSSTVETGSNSMGPTQSKRSRLGSSGNSAADVKSSLYT